MKSLLEPPYYAVIFTSKRTKIENDAYQEMAKYMEELARMQDGFLGIESARDDIGITVSYWRDLEAIKNWKNHTEHLVAQKFGRLRWYSNYTVRIAKVEKVYAFHKS